MSTTTCKACNGYGVTYTRAHRSIGGAMPAFETPCLPCGGTGGWVYCDYCGEQVDGEICECQESQEEEYDNMAEYDV